MLLRGIIRTRSVTLKAARKNHSVTNLLSCRGWWNMQKGRDGKTPFEKAHGNKPTQVCVPFGEKVLAKQITTDPMNRMNPRYQYGIWLGMRNNSAKCFSLGMPMVCLELAKSEDWKKDRREVDSGQWTEVRVDPIPIPPLPFVGARIQRERITKQDIDEFAATIGCPGCNAIKGQLKGTPLALMGSHMAFTDALVDWVPASCTKHINVWWKVVLSPHILPRAGPFHSQSSTVDDNGLIVRSREDLM